jgi:hypothetical protein
MVQAETLALSLLLLLLLLLLICVGMLPTCICEFNAARQVQQLQPPTRSHQLS